MIFLFDHPAITEQIIISTKRPCQVENQVRDRDLKSLHQRQLNKKSILKGRFSVKFFQIKNFSAFKARSVLDAKHHSERRFCCLEVWNKSAHLLIDS